MGRSDQQFPTCSRTYQTLQGREEEIARLTENSYQNFMARHADKATDDRAQTHLQACSLTNWIKFFQNQPDLDAGMKSKTKRDDASDS